MSKINDDQLDKMSIENRFQLRSKCAENGDIESLLTIAKYHFLHGSAATNLTILPEMCYYYGRLHRAEDLQEFLHEKSFILSMLPLSCKELAQSLLNIGQKFPHLNESEVSYLEDRFCDSKTFELFDIIMFDSKLLPRPIKKFDKKSLSRNTKDFSRKFLIEIYNCFLNNEELDEGFDKLYFYSRIENKIIRKKYEHAGPGDYCLIQPIRSSEFWNLMKVNYNEDCADWFIKKLCFIKDCQKFKEVNFYGLNPESIEKASKEYFNDSSKINDVKALVANFWLTKVNSKTID